MTWEATSLCLPRIYTSASDLAIHAQLRVLGKLQIKLPDVLFQDLVGVLATELTPTATEITVL